MNELAPWRSDPKYGGMSDFAAEMSWKASQRRPKLVTERIHLVPFEEIQLSTHRRDLVKGLIPRVGLSVIWGKPKCGKSFWLFDCLMHVALGWEYRGRRVHQGPVVYCAFEGQSGLEARVEAFRLAKLDGHAERVPFYLMPVTLSLVKDHRALIKAIRAKLGDEQPVAVALDTLNRSLAGSESSDEDMSAYVQATDAIREAFECAVPVVHHCGIDGSRPRGHTSLTGAADAQIEVKRDTANRVIVEVELAKDGPQGGQIISALEVVTVGKDEDGEEITSCVVNPCEDTAAAQRSTGPKLSADQQTFYRILYDAGAFGLSLEEWNNQAKAVGIGVTRKAKLYDLRKALEDRKMVRDYGGRWKVNHDD